MKRPISTNDAPLYRILPSYQTLNKTHQHAAIQVTTLENISLWKLFSLNNNNSNKCTTEGTSTTFVPRNRTYDEGETLNYYFLADTKMIALEGSSNIRST